MTSPKSGAEVPTGAHPKNTGGKPGRSGRPPQILIDFCRNLVADEAVQAQVSTILRNGDHPHFVALWKAVADRAYGKPTASVELSGPDGSPLPIRIWRFGKREIAF